MLPPGHIAAGFLVADAFIKIVKPDITPAQTQQLLYWGMFFGFMPDLDYFLAFAKEKALIISDFKKNNHRKFISHAPILWLAAGLLIYFFAQSPFFKAFGLLFWLGSWSHFILDTIEYGVMWLWPFSNRKLYLRPMEDKNIPEKAFWRYWISFLKSYTSAITFYLEIALIFLALIQYFK